MIDQGGGRPGQGQRQRPGDRPADRGPRQPREVVAPSGPAAVTQVDPNEGDPYVVVAGPIMVLPSPAESAKFGRLKAGES